MEKTKIPEGYTQVMPYFILEGAAHFSQFAQTVFGAKEKNRSTRENGMILHAEIGLGDSTIMFCDSTEQFPPATGQLFVYVAQADETYHKALQEGATSLMEPADQDYGRSCGVRDPQGVVWWITSVA